MSATVDLPPLHGHEWRVLVVEHEDLLSWTVLQCLICGTTSITP